MESTNKSDVKHYENVGFFTNYYATEYDKWVYSPWLSHLEKMQKFRVLQLLELTNSDRVLDVGSGTGKYVLIMSQYARSVVGLDFSKAMIKKAKKKITDSKLTSKISLVVGDSLNLPFKSNSFDKSITMNTLQYVSDDKKVINELERVSRKKLVLDGVSKTELRMVYPMINVVNWIKNLLNMRPIGIYKNYYTISSLKAKASGKGSSIGRIFGCGITLPALTKDVFGTQVPSPFYLLQKIPKAYKLIEKIELKYASNFPFKHLGTHIILEVNIHKS